MRENPATLQRGEYQYPVRQHHEFLQEGFPPGKTVRVRGNFPRRGGGGRTRSSAPRQVLVLVAEISSWLARLQPWAVAAQSVIAGACHAATARLPTTALQVRNGTPGRPAAGGQWGSQVGHGWKCAMGNSASGASFCVAPRRGISGSWRRCWRRHWRGQKKFRQHS